MEASDDRLRVAASVTFASLLVFGLVVMVIAMVVLSAFDAPSWVVTAPWLIPTVGVIGWTLTRARPAIATNDDEAWLTYAVLYVLVGPDEPRSAPARVVVAVLVGGPIAWSLMAVWLVALVGLTDT